MSSLILMGASNDKRWKVGELARATGVTVRALHHYDELGLLVPCERTGSGHRLYAEEDIRRLYRILALRRLGFPLHEIASLLDDGSLSLADTVRRHLERVERDLAHHHQLELSVQRAGAATTLVTWPTWPLGHPKSAWSSR